MLLSSHGNTTVSWCFLTWLVSSHLHTPSYSACHRVRWVPRAPPCTFPLGSYHMLYEEDQQYTWKSGCTLFVETKLIKDEMASLIHNRILYLKKFWILINAKMFFKDWRYFPIWLMWYVSLVVLFHYSQSKIVFSFQQTNVASRCNG